MHLIEKWMKPGQICPNYRSLEVILAARIAKLVDCTIGAAYGRA